MGTLTCESCGEEYKTRRFRSEPDELACPCGGRRSSFSNAGRGTKRPISPASDLQREKVKDAISIISGRGPCDPMHIWDRRLGGCDDPLCVVPALRSEHRAYEEKRLDILPALVAGGFFAELAHVMEEHKVSPTRLVERLTGQRYGPLHYLEARVVELEGELSEVLAR